jgi:dihydrofolate synthase/folylpolyglutamate synthase
LPEQIASPGPDDVLEPLEMFGMHLGLKTMRALMEGLGHPEHDLNCVVVAGTNGKGSTAALLESILRAADYRSGLYTSPHLERVEERIRIAGRRIDRNDLAAILRSVIDTAQRVVGHPPTYFEALTAAALLAFARADIDLAILEVGLGGRLDATNVVEPRLSLITGIAFDHERYLGHTLPEIAREKAGILRDRRPALAWTGDDSVRTVLEEAATTRGAWLEFADRSVGVRPESEQASNAASESGRPRNVEVRTPHRSYHLTLALPGHHQLSNLGLAVRAAEVLRDLGLKRLGTDAIRAGVASAAWPGRMEWVRLPDGRDLLLDAAHNPAGVSALAAYLDELDRPFDLLFGVLDDKRVEAMLPPLARRAKAVTLTQPRSPRALDVERLGGLLSDREAVTCDPDFAAALDAALESSDDLLVICGSIYLVGAVRTELRRRFGVPERGEGRGARSEGRGARGE